MTTEVQVPGFSWLAKFYADFRAAIRERGRVNVPEITEESESDPYMQLEAAVALVGHLLSARVDFVARHLFLPTSLRAQSVDCLLRLMGLQLNPASPSVVDVVAELTRRFAADQASLVPARSQFGTVPDVDVPAIIYESGADAQGISRDDQLLAVGYDTGTSAYADWALGAAPWVGAAEAGDLIYIGHPDVMFDGCDIDLSTAQSGITGVWEYYGSSENQPDAVSYSAPDLTLTLTSLLGSSSRAGATVTVYCVTTQQSASAASVWSGGLNKVTVSDALGQTVVSTDTRDYIVSVEWTELTDVAGGNDELDSTSSDDVSWDLPQTLTDTWETTTVDGEEGYWVRWRVISVAVPTSPVLDAGGSGVDPGTQAAHYVLISVTQGESVEDAVGSSDGTANQTFALTRTPYIGDSIYLVEVDGDEWSVTDDPTTFYSSDPTERVCLLDQTSDGGQQVVFGDGSSYGAIPTDGAQIVVYYRIGADEDGNVGAGAISRNVSGLAYLTDITNPRAAAGWAIAEGSTREDLERVKRTKPASLRAGNRIVTAGDAAALVVDEFTTEDSSRPVARAWGVEEQYGDKTIGLFVVGGGGGLLSSSILQEINEWANGEETNDEVRLLLANLELTAANYTPHEIDGTITVTVSRSSAGVEDQVRTILEDLLRPLKQRDGGTYLWAPGGGVYSGRVSPTFIGGEVYSGLTVQSVLDVSVDTLEGVTPAVTVVLAANELPTFGTWTVTVVVV